MCDICWAHTECPRQSNPCSGTRWNGEWHVPCRHWWTEWRKCMNSTPPWLEEARHSDIRMLGNGSRPKDGHSIFYWMPYGVKLVNKPFQIYRPGILRRLRITGQDTTQECLSFID